MLHRGLSVVNIYKLNKYKIKIKKVKKTVDDANDNDYHLFVG